MKFGPIPIDHAEGTIVAHSTRLRGRILKKGHILRSDDIALLSEAGHESIIAAVLETNDVPEDEAAGRISQALAGNNIKIGKTFTGRCNLIASAQGLITFDPTRLDNLNLIDETVTIATLPVYEPVMPGQLIATVKIIPFSAPGEIVTKVETLAQTGEPLISVSSFQQKRIGLIMTRLPGMKESILDNTRQTAAGRIESLGSTITEEIRCEHRVEEVETSLSNLSNKCDIILLFGASAVVDRKDILPSAVVRCGGSVDHFGMPVDPGNLLFFGHLNDRSVIGMPGCARSPKLNGFDWVLWRLLAEIPVSPKDIMLMGAGGLLKEISERGQLRQSNNISESDASIDQFEVHALVLAAGSSKRMGSENKLLADINGVPLVRFMIEALLSSNVTSITVVTGHEGEQVAAALSEFTNLSFVHNPDYDAGLSTSLKAGLRALPETLDGVMICLGDMPLVTPVMVNELIEAFDPDEGRSICVPVYGRKRGNPILWSKTYLSRMISLSGDMGARPLLEEYNDQIFEVVMQNDGVLFDIDTPERLQSLRGRLSSAG